MPQPGEVASKSSEEAALNLCHMTKSAQLRPQNSACCFCFLFVHSQTAHTILFRNHDPGPSLNAGPGPSQGPIRSPGPSPGLNPGSSLGPSLNRGPGPGFNPGLGPGRQPNHFLFLPLAPQENHSQVTDVPAGP